MPRRNTFDISKEVYELLKNEGELSINVIAKKLKTFDSTSRLCLDDDSYIKSAVLLLIIPYKIAKNDSEIKRVFSCFILY